jgi:hypothetical protein
MSSHTKPSKKTLIVRHRQGRKHITNCKGADLGYCQAGERFAQIHHVVCVSAMTDARISDKVQDKGKMQFIRECLKLTTWNVNDAGKINSFSNVVGLPLKRAFVRKPSAEWNGWPCHQVEHNLYFDAVCEQLYLDVWVSVLKERKKCQDCQKECLIKARAIEEELSNQSQAWYGFLHTRGSDEEGGTAACWDARDTKNTWYKPFSMAPDPTPRKLQKKPSRWTEALIKKMFKV